ncbi:GNAT family N-acetyltransferase [Pelagibacterium lentulum]|uniref:N-acetyltransferase n=1 Tax=Pelagibacterium lentulum TaxID=2029865 RepID=A0A916R5W5_9HYPH|nr:GNAT family N-acetyltransferase [Pelagibacterium lentulum]GGA37492.1 N-acetyltransferase [Pelagibacterium lentulum]
MSIDVRLLGKEDARAYAALRLSGLKNDPRAFASDYATEASRDPDYFRQRLEQNHVFGAFEGTRLKGIVGYGIPRQSSMAHRGHVWGMLVDENARGTGLGALLLETLVGHARAQGLRQLHLGVGTYNEAAIRLYRRAGFSVYGTEPRALHIENTDIDEHLMVRFLDKKEEKL